jgi:hypothetical protein
MPLYNLLVVPVVLTLVLTVVASPLLLLGYRRRVRAWMDAGSGGAEAGWGGAAETEYALPASITFKQLDAAAGGTASTPAAEIARLGARGAALSYAAGGLVHAFILALVFIAAHSDIVSTHAIAVAWPIFCVPALFTVLYVLGVSGAVQIAVFAALVVALYLAPGISGDLALLVFQLHVLVPAVLFLVFSLRFWRGIAPFVLLVLAAASLLWVAGAELARAMLSEPGAITWLFRLGGFALGAWLGYRLLSRLARAYRARRFSDQELFVDTWWLLYTLAQTIIFVITRNGWMLAVLLSFPAYLLVKRWLLARLIPRQTPPPFRLLLLRVFRGDRRAERLFDEFARRWRYVGSIEMIGGADLALRNVGPIDFVRFLSRALRRQFIRSPADLAARLEDLDDERPDPDGRWRAEHFFCHADSWRPVMRALATRCDVVLMDLRGFGGKRTGSLYELEHLAAHEPGKPVLLVVSGSSELDALRGLLGAQGTTADTAMHSEWLVLPAGRQAPALGRRAFGVLTARLPVKL